MGKFWAVLFVLVPIFGVLTFALAPANHIWMPENFARHGFVIDHLFYFILALTGVVFIITEGALVWFLWRYDGKANKTPVKFMHGSHTLEVVWTIVPAATLLFIAIYQINAWADAKMRPPKGANAPTLEVTGRQFEWRLRYPGPDGILGNSDDIFTVNDMRLPVDEDIVIKLKSMDVIHSFFIPQMRIKQDAMPGMSQNVWFHPTQEGEFDIVCSQLCGWGHYKMKGRLKVVSRSEYDRWLQEMYAAQEATQPAPAAKSDKKVSE